MGRLSTERHMETENTNQKEAKSRIKKRNNRFARKFEIPDWLNSIPANFQEFLVMGKPDAKRVLMVFKKNFLRVMDKQGRRVVCRVNL